MNRINEIGNTAKGRGWLGAVQARAKNRRDRARLNAEIPRSEREKESKKQQDIMNRASDTAFKNTNTSDFLTHKQMKAGAEDFYRKNNYSNIPVDYDDTVWDDYQNESKNMNKKLIRLTEQDLHRIVKESVNKVLNEIQYGGESLHGNNPEDWETMRNLRSDHMGLYPSGYEDEYDKNERAWDRDENNATSLYGNDKERMRLGGKRAFDKANRINRNLGY